MCPALVDLAPVCADFAGDLAFAGFRVGFLAAAFFAAVFFAVDLAVRVFLMDAISLFSTSSFFVTGVAPFR